MVLLPVVEKLMLQFISPLERTLEQVGSVPSPPVMVTVPVGVPPHGLLLITFTETVTVPPTSEGSGVTMISSISVATFSTVWLLLSPLGLCLSSPVYTAEMVLVSWSPEPENVVKLMTQLPVPSGSSVMEQFTSAPVMLTRPDGIVVPLTGRTLTETVTGCPTSDGLGKCDRISVIVSTLGGGMEMVNSRVRELSVLIGSPPATVRERRGTISGTMVL